MPKMVKARPVATWLASSVRVSTPKPSAITSPAAGAGEDPQRGAAGDDGNAEGGDGAHQHHALDAEVEDAGLLDHQFAERREQERCRRGDQGDEDRGGQHGAGVRRRMR